MFIMYICYNVGFRTGSFIEVLRSVHKIQLIIQILIELEESGGLWCFFYLQQQDDTASFFAGRGQKQCMRHFLQRIQKCIAYFGCTWNGRDLWYVLEVWCVIYRANTWSCDSVIMSDTESYFKWLISQLDLILIACIT